MIELERLPPPPRLPTGTDLEELGVFLGLEADPLEERDRALGSERPTVAPSRNRHNSR